MQSVFPLDEIQGQNRVLKYLKSYLLDPNKIPSLLIFYGPDGVGKLSIAERFVCAILCERRIACGNCASCKLFFTHQHPDFILFPADTKIGIGSEKDPEEFTARWLQSKRIPYKPHMSDFRIILFPDASLIGNEAETSLLKTLEESPHHSKFIFIVNDLNKLKQTIISRAVCIPFDYLNQQIVRSLREKLEIPGEEFYGGSLEYSKIPVEFSEFAKKKVSENLYDSYNLLGLENWIREYKDSHPEWEEDFDYSEFLEYVSLLMIYFYSKDGIDKNSIQIEKILEFKKNIHRDIPGLESYLISILFFHLGRLS